MGAADARDADNPLYSPNAPRCLSMVATTARRRTASRLGPPGSPPSPCPRDAAPGSPACPRRRRRRRSRSPRHGRSPPACPSRDRTGRPSDASSRASQPEGDPVSTATPRPAEGSGPRARGTAFVPPSRGPGPRGLKGRPRGHRAFHDAVRCHLPGVRSSEEALGKFELDRWNRSKVPTHRSPSENGAKHASVFAPVTTDHAWQTPPPTLRAARASPRSASPFGRPRPCDATGQVRPPRRSPSRLRFAPAARSRPSPRWGRRRRRSCG